MSQTPRTNRAETPSSQPSLVRTWASIGPDGTRLLVLLAVFIALAIFF